MIYLSKIIIPLITLIVIIYALYKKVPIYDTFLEGIKEGLDLSLEIFPSMFAMIVSVSVIINSHIITDIISNINITIFPKEILPIAILRPNVMSMTYAVFMTLPIFLRNIRYLKITKYTLFVGALDIMVTASIFSLLFGNDSWKIPLIDISPQQIVMIATAVAWFGMKSLSGPIWIAAFILAILRLPQVSNALGFYGVLFIIFALGGIICQLRLMSKHANCFSIESIKSDFLGYQPAIPLNETVHLPQSTNYQYVTLPQNLLKEKSEKERKRL